MMQIKRKSGLMDKIVWGVYIFVMGHCLSWMWLPELSCLAAEVAPNMATPVQEILPNGLKVLVLEDHSFPTVSTFIWYKVGARNESSGTTGISHVLEHLLFENVGIFKNGQMGEIIARNGGQFNGYTSDDFTTYFETLPPSKLELALRIEAERMRSASFSQVDLENELARIKKEFEQQDKEFAEVLAKEVRIAAYQRHPYHRPTRGWRNDVENLNPGQVKAFYDRFYRPDNATLVIVGDIQRQPAMTLVKKYFAGIAKPEGIVSSPATAEPEQKGERRVQLKYSGKQEMLQVAYHAPAMADADAPAMSVLEKLLNAGHSGRLKSKLVNSKVCSSALSAFEAKKDPGLFTISCTAMPGYGEHKVLETVDALISQLKSQPVPEAELRRAKNYAEYAFVIQRDGPSRIGFELGYFETISNWQNAYSWVGKLQNVTAADIERVCKRYFSADNRVVGWLSSPNAVNPASPKTPGSGDPGGTPRAPAGKDAREHLPVMSYKNRDEEVVAAAAPVAPVAAVTSDKQPAGIESAEADIANLSLPGVSNVKQATLSNGVKLVVFESHLAPMVHICGAVKAGAGYDPAGKKGLSQLAAALLNSGCLKHNATAMMSLQEDIGLPPPAMLKFDSDANALNFQSSCLVRDLPRQIALLADTLISPTLAEADLEKAKLEVGSYLKGIEETAQGRVERALKQSLLAPGSSFFPSDPGLRLKTVNSAKVADLKAFFEQLLKPDATVVVISGDISLNQAVNLLEKNLAVWSGKFSGRKPVLLPNSKRILSTSVPLSDKTQGIVGLGQLLSVSFKDADFASLLLADYALNDHPFLSRTGLSLNMQAPLLDSADITCRLESLGDSTLWSLLMTVDNKLLPQAVKVFSTETANFAASGLTSEELSEIKRYVLGAYPVRFFGNLHSAGNSILSAVMQDRQADYLPCLLNEVRNSNCDSVNRFIQTGLRLKQASVVVAADSQSLKALRRQASGLHPAN